MIDGGRLVEESETSYRGRIAEEAKASAEARLESSSEPPGEGAAS
jgi:hypothetical protein